MTTTFATTNIILVVYAGGMDIWAEDFSHETAIDKEDPTGLPRELGFHLDKAHVRKFVTMTDFTVWLHEVGAVVNRCIVVGRLPSGS